MNKKPANKNLINYEFLFDGIEYNEFYVNLILQAQKSIVLHTYIFEMDQFGTNIFNALIEASKRDVSITVVIDNFGTSSLSQEHLNLLKKYSIKIISFNKVRLFNLYKWGRRLHHKVLSIDGSKAIIGGINITSAYDRPYEHPRLDFACFIESDICERIDEYCEYIQNTPKINKQQIDMCVQNEHARLEVKANDWVGRRKDIAENYEKLIDEASDEILIINSYFFPRRKFLKKLAQASKRGVKVTLILPGISEWQSHVWATEYLYKYLLENKIEVYRWKKSILHGKMAIIDNRFTIIGSFNLHYTSFQGNLEMNVEIDSKIFAEKTLMELKEKVFTHRELVEYNELSKSRVLVFLKRLFFYSIISIVSNFLLGFIHQEELEQQSKTNPKIVFLRAFLSLILLVIGILGIFLPIIPGLLFIALALVTSYPILIKNHKNSD